MKPSIFEGPQEIEHLVMLYEAKKLAYCQASEIVWSNRKSTQSYKQS